MGGQAAPFRRLWGLAQAREASLSDEQLELLAGLEADAALLGLPPILRAPEHYRTEPRRFTPAPSFQNFSNSMALPLKAGLWAGEFRAHSLEWCEKLLRFCEVRHAELPGRAREKWPARKERRQGVIELIVLFLEAYRAASDLRYVNTALKLLELAPSRPEAADSVCLLLLTRAAVQSEAVLARLRRTK